MTDSDRVTFHEVEAEHPDHGMMLVHFINIPNTNNWAVDPVETMFETDDEDDIVEIMKHAEQELRNERDDVDNVFYTQRTLE